jgi:pyruvate formate lyase activating enzyme
MQGIIYHTRSFSVHDGPGIRKTIFFKGCPLSCIWCHNPESQSFDFEKMTTNQKIGDKLFTKVETVGRKATVAELMDEIRADIPFFDESGGGVTLSGGEPLAQPNFAIALLKACKLEGIHTAIDTCGFASKNIFEQSIPYTDLYLFDLKLAESKEHLHYTGVDNKMIIDNLRFLSSAGKRLVIRIPLVEGITDSKHNINGIKSILSSTKGIQRIDILPYHSLAKHKFTQCNREYTLSDLGNYPMEKAKKIEVEFEGLAPIISVGG